MHGGEEEEGRRCHSHPEVLGACRVLGAGSGIWNSLNLRAETLSPSHPIQTPLFRKHLCNAQGFAQNNNKTYQKKKKRKKKRAQDETNFHVFCFVFCAFPFFFIFPRRRQSWWTAGSLLLSLANKHYRIPTHISVFQTHCELYGPCSSSIHRANVPGVIHKPCQSVPKHAPLSWLI